MRPIILLIIGTIVLLFFFSGPLINPVRNGVSNVVQDWFEKPASDYLAELEDRPVTQIATSSDGASSAKEVSKVLRPATPAPREGRAHFEYVLPPPLPASGPTTKPDLATTTQPMEVKISPPASPPPPVDEETIFKAVVKIECPAKNGLGKYIGSGFVLPGDIVVTAAHVVSDSGSKECTVIFPRERRPIHYLRGTIRDFDKLKERLDEDGIDFALLDLPPLSSYPEARAIFSSYPFMPYPFCEDPKMLGDTTYHYGYPANFKDLDYLERLKGEALEYADIGGTESKVSEEGTIYKAPIFSFSRDESRLHPYMMSRTGVFYGASGGPAFNATKQCILGPHHGFSAGSSESFSIFMILGWEGVRVLFKS